MKQRITDPLHGHCLCELHASGFNPRRVGIRFFFIPPEAVPAEMVCGRCAPSTVLHGGLMVSEDSLKSGVVTFLKNAAYSLRALKDKAIPLEDYKKRNKS